MANNNKLEGLSQVDSTLEKYFSKHMASSLVCEQQVLLAKQKKEVEQYTASAPAINLGVGANAMTRLATAVDTARHAGQWNSKTTDDLIKTVKNSWKKDYRICNDIRTMTQAFYKELCRVKNHGKDSQELAVFATKYVEDRLNDLVLEQLARQRVPPGTISYIAQHTFDDSMIGSIMKTVALNQTVTDRLIDEKADDLYDPSIGTMAAAFVGSVAIDIASLKMGGVGVAAKKGAAKLGAGKWVSRGAGTVADIAAWETAGHAVDGVNSAMQGKTDMSPSEYVKSHAQSVLGDEDGVAKIKNGAKDYRKRQTEFQAQLDSHLMRHVKIKPKEYADDTKHISNGLLWNHRGNSITLFDSVRADFKKNGIAVNPKAPVPQWMAKLTAKQCRAWAASFYAHAVEMKENGMKTIRMNGKVMTLQQVAQRAYDYAHMASLKGTKGNMFNFNENVRQNANKSLTDARGSGHKMFTKIESTFSKQGIPFKNTNPPEWMFNKTAKENRVLAASYYSLALQMKRDGKQSTKVNGGKVMTLQQVSQRAYDYVRCAWFQEKEEQDRRQEEKERIRQSSEKNTSSSNGYYEQQSTGAQAGNDQSQLQNVNPADASSLSDGWGDAFNSMGLGDLSSVKKNMGYAMAMLPDMLIGMFTGKNPDMKLGDNLLPLASIVGGMFVKNPMMKLMMMGYGAVSLFNSASKAAIKQREESLAPTRVYKSYADEPLNPRISNPVMSGSSMVATVDGRPVVINISSDAVQAYQQGKIPLNTLANAVLRKYDENINAASQGYERNISEEEERKVARQIK